MPLVLPAFVPAVGAFLLDITPSLAGGLAGGLIMNSFKPKPSKLDQVRQYANDFHTFAKAAETLVGFAGHFGLVGDKAQNAELTKAKLEAETKAAEYERDLKQVALEKAKLELEAMKNGDMPWAGSEAPPEAGLAGIPTRKRTAKKPTPRVRRAAAT